VVVRVVKGSPAAKAGLVAARQRVTVGGIVGGDAIVAVDETPIATPAEVADLVAEHKPGDKLTLEIVRRGVRRTVAVTLGNVPG
jgi:S1-C subfamily serine protease